MGKRVLEKLVVQQFADCKFNAKFQVSRIISATAYKLMHIYSEFFYVSFSRYKDFKTNFCEDMSRSYRATSPIAWMSYSNSLRNDESINLKGILSIPTVFDFILWTALSQLKLNLVRRVTNLVLWMRQKKALLLSCSAVLTKKNCIELYETRFTWFCRKNWQQIFMISQKFYQIKTICKIGS